MTCIVAIAKDGVVHMGADSAGSDEDTGVILPYVIPKVFKRNGYVIGYAGSFRFGKLLQYIFDLPTCPASVNTSEKLDEFMNKIVMQSIKKQAKELDLDKEEMDFDALIGLKGHIFEISNDWCAIEASMPYNVCGSGTKYALGSLHTTQVWKDPVKRINVALAAAAENDLYVAPPFNIISN
jgi:ATP-dependent protease HslVU (ClpYQ) peptidase subunit